MSKKCNPSSKVKKAASTLSTSTNKTAKSKAGTILKNHQDNKH